MGYVPVAWWVTLFLPYIFLPALVSGWLLCYSLWHYQYIMFILFCCIWSIRYLCLHILVYLFIITSIMISLGEKQSFLVPFLSNVFCWSFICGFDILIMMITDQDKAPVLFFYLWVELIPCFTGEESYPRWCQWPAHHQKGILYCYQEKGKYWFS